MSAPFSSNSSVVVVLNTAFGKSDEETGFSSGVVGSSSRHSNISEDDGFDLQGPSSS